MAESVWHRLKQHRDVECKAVQLKATSTRPQVGLFARRDIKKGERFLHNAPLATAASQDRCFYCLAFLEQSVDCERCTARYCSTRCRSQHQVHKHSCGKQLPIETVLLIEAAWNRPDDKITYWQSCWSDLLNLLPNGPPLLDQAQACGAALQTMVDASEIAKASQRLRNNNFTISSPDLVPIGCGIYPLGALLNHSCLANTAAVYLFQDHRAPIQCFVALTDIKKGTEITHNYCDLVQRREARWTQLGFHCICLRCRHPWQCESQLAPVEPDPIDFSNTPLSAQQEIDQLIKIRFSSVLQERQRYIRLVGLFLQQGRLVDAYAAAKRVWEFDKRFYTFQTHPSLIYQSNLLEKIQAALENL